MSVAKPYHSELLPDNATEIEAAGQIADVVLKRPTGRGWIIAFLIALGIVNILVLAIIWVLVFGVGVWGINVPVAWALAIINFVWWIGIGHAGTLISAILLLFYQDWRTSINRFAEAMTLLAVACAGMFPLLHLGRPQFFYWLFPYPATTTMWPQFRSPLIWDVFAVSTYFSVSVMFWYMGLIPDMTAMSQRAKTRFVAKIFGIMSFGWRNSARHWKHYSRAYLILAALCTPLVVSVHTSVSWDFAVSIVGPWHSTVFPPYFVGGAIFCGFAMVALIAVPMRWYYGLEELITIKHFDNMGKLMLASGMVVGYGYLMDAWFAWYLNDPYDSYIYTNFFFGPYWWSQWGLILCNVIVPQFLWFPTVRRTPWMLIIVSLFINVGMWLERFVIIALSLRRGHSPSSWAMYYPTVWEWALYIGTFGFFLTFMLLFFRFLPSISMFEVRELVHKEQEGAGS